MFGIRLSLAASALVVGTTFLSAQAPPDRSTQGTAVQQTQQGGGTPSTPSVPSAPAAQQTPTLPGQTQNPAQIQGTQQGQPQSGQSQTQQNPGTTQQYQGTTQQNQSTNQQQNQGQNQQGQQAQQGDDSHFVQKAGEIDLAEINIGRLAAQRASRPDVRQFANQLVQDHSAHLNMLNQVANRNNMRGAERMDQEHQQLFQKLSGMQAQEFDREFVHKMVEGHKKAIELYQHASQNARNADVKNLAAQTLPALKAHEQIARQLSGQNQQGQTNQQQPTSSERHDATRTDGATRTDQSQSQTEQGRTEQNRNNQSGTDQNRNNQNQTDPTRNQQNRNDNNQQRPQDR